MPGTQPSLHPCVGCVAVLLQHELQSQEHTENGHLHVLSPWKLSHRLASCVPWIKSLLEKCPCFRTALTTSTTSPPLSSGPLTCPRALKQNQPNPPQPCFASLPPLRPAPASQGVPVTPQGSSGLQRCHPGKLLVWRPPCHGAAQPQDTAADHLLPGQSPLPASGAPLRSGLFQEIPAAFREESAGPSQLSFRGAPMSLGLLILELKCPLIPQPQLREVLSNTGSNGRRQPKAELTTNERKHRTEYMVLPTSYFLKSYIQIKYTQ